jgi:hypothetical protein
MKWRWRQLLGVVPPRANNELPPGSNQLRYVLTSSTQERTAFNQTSITLRSAKAGRSHLPLAVFSGKAEKILGIDN